MADTGTAEPTAPVNPPPDSGAPVEPPHQLPGSEPEAPPEDDGAPLDDVVDEDSHRPRHRGSRAKSKMAAARINTLTKANAELRERLAAVEKAQKPANNLPRAVVPTVSPAPKVDFTEAEPTLDQFADKDDPYGAWQRALATYDRRKEAAEAQAQHMQAHQQRTQQGVAEYYRQVEATHKQRLLKAIEANPAHYQALASVQIQPPPLLDWAIMLDNDSADVALFLATHPDVLDEFVLMTDAKPVTEQTVATTRRLLRQRMTAGATGSVAPAKALPVAPRPPNPVRTVLTRTGTEPPPEGASIADHAKYWGPKARR